MVMSTKKIVRGIDKSLNKAVSEINASTPKPDMKDDGAELKAAVAPKKAPTFGEAFKAARAAGDKTFTFGGKSYHTRTAEEESRMRRAAAPRAGNTSTPKTGNTPAAKSGVKPETEKFVKNLRKAVYRDATGKGYVSDKVSPVRNPKNNKVERSEVTPISSLKSQPATKANWNKGLRSASPAMLQRKEEPKPKPGSLLMRKKEEKPKPGSLLMKKAKGGKIDGAALRGKTRAMKKGK